MTRSGAGKKLDGEGGCRSNGGLLCGESPQRGVVGTVGSRLPLARRDGEGRRYNNHLKDGPEEGGDKKKDLGAGRMHDCPRERLKEF